MGWYMLDYEDMILARQEEMEIWEDDPDDPYLGLSVDDEEGGVYRMYGKPN